MAILEEYRRRYWVLAEVCPYLCFRSPFFQSPDCGVSIEPVRFHPRSEASLPLHMPLARYDSPPNQGLRVVFGKLVEVGLGETPDAVSSAKRIVVTQCCYSVYQRSNAVPQANPAPNPHSSTRSPRLTFPSLTASSNAKGKASASLSSVLPLRLVFYGAAVERDTLKI